MAAAGHPYPQPSTSIHHARVPTRGAPLKGAPPAKTWPCRAQVAPLRAIAQLLCVPPLMGTRIEGGTWRSWTVARDGREARSSGPKTCSTTTFGEVLLAVLRLLEVSTASSRRIRASVDRLSSLLSVRPAIGLSASGGLWSRQAALRPALQKPLWSSANLISSRREHRSRGRQAGKVV